jgi:hypothetical protein
VRGVNTEATEERRGGGGRRKRKRKRKKVSHGGTEAQGKRERSERRKESGLDGIGENRWWLVVGGWPMRRLKGLLGGCFGFFKNC